MTKSCHSHRLRIRGLAFTQNDQQIVTGSEDRTVRIWNWQTDEQVTTLPPQSSKILALVSCGPQLVATAGTDNLIHLWDLTARRDLGQLPGHTGSVSALAYRDGVLVSGGYDTFVRIWQIPAQLEEGVRSAQRVE